MKYLLDMHVPVEQYGYIGVTNFEGTPIEAYDLYKEIKETMKPVEGLSTKEFNQALDRYLKDGTGELETYQMMNSVQKNVLQQIKKSLNRVNGLKHE